MRALLGSLLLLACGSSVGGSPSVPDSGGVTLDSAVSPVYEKPECRGGSPTGGTLSPRGDVAGALSDKGDKMVVFGGNTAVTACGAIPASEHSGETWLLDVACGGWESVPGAGPRARARHAMVEDAARNRALLFGGRTRSGNSGNYTLFSDVWTFDFTSRTWSELPTSGDAPSPRANAAIAWSSVTQELFVFGGNASPRGTEYDPRSDLYVLSVETGVWRELKAPRAPKPRLFHAMTWDERGRTLYVFGGAGADALTSPTFYKDLWKFDVGSGSWSEVVVGGNPGGRISASLGFDPRGGVLLLFGGHDDGDLGNQNDLWVLDPGAASPAWARLGFGDTFQKPSAGPCDFPADFSQIDADAPERRSAFAVGFLRGTGSFAVVGGKSDCGLLSDALWFDAKAFKFLPIRKTAVGQSCLRVSTTCVGLCG